MRTGKTIISINGSARGKTRDLFCQKNEEKLAKFNLKTYRNFDKLLTKSIITHFRALVHDFTSEQPLSLRPQWVSGLWRLGH